MTAPRGLVLDANILMRAVLGRRVLELLQRYEDVVEFYSPDVCFDDARFYLAQVLRKRGLDPNHGERVLTQVSALVHPVDISLYTEYERLARERIEIRDPDDWPIVAAAMLLNLPIWTEDRDFFGTGLPTWTTERVEIYLKGRD
jgi:predicted nucleic acid-binding protein